MNLKINTRETSTLKSAIVDVNFFNEFDVELKHDSVASTFQVKFYFDPRNQEHAELACVSHYHEAILEHNGETLITGYILSNCFNNSSKKELVEIGGYSKPGVLEDCEIPTTLYPLEINGMSLRQIAQKLIAPFSLNLVVDADVGGASAEVFTSVSNPTLVEGRIQDEGSSDAVAPVQDLTTKIDKTITRANAKESQNIKAFLTMLATQRNVLLSHDAKGNLLLTEAKTTLKPLMYFNVPKDGLIATRMALTFDGQAMHSHITVIKQANIDGGNAGEFTIRNPYVPILYRPRVITQSSGDDITIQEAAQNALAAELKAIKLVISIDRWDLDKMIIRPNNIISVLNPDCFIYNKTDFFIESVRYKGNSKETTAVLTCVLPEVYNKKRPKNIFVDPHHNLPRF